MTRLADEPRKPTKSLDDELASREKDWQSPSSDPNAREMSTAFIVSPYLMGGILI